MKYITVLDGIEEIITKDEQMFNCINKGGEIYSIDEEGKREIIANGKDGFLRGRPGFPVYPEVSKNNEQNENSEEYIEAAEILLGLEV